MSAPSGRRRPAPLHRLLFLAAGAAVLGLVLAHADLAETLRHVGAVGWSFLVILALYMAEFVAKTLTWQATFSSLPASPATSYRLWRALMFGEAFNLASAHLGGEALKALLLKRLYAVPYAESVASLVLCRTVTVLSLVAFLAGGLVLILHTPGIAGAYSDTAIAGLAVLAAAAIMLLLAQHLRFASRAGRWLFRRRRAPALLDRVAEFEEQLLSFYRTRRRSLGIAFFWALANWLLGAVTLYYTFRFIGAPISLAEAWIMEAFTQLVRAASFFIPGHLGAQEGALVLVADALTGRPEAGLAAAIVRRARELVWVGWGLVLGWRDWPAALASGRNRRAG